MPVMTAPVRAQDPQAQADSILEEMLKDFGIAGGYDERMLTVIQNPSTSHLGIVLARSIKPIRTGVQLLNADHYRILDDTVIDSAAYPYLSVEAIVGAHEGRRIAYAHVLTPQKKELPLPSIMPYKRCKLSPAEYDHIKNTLSSQNPDVQLLGIDLVHQAYGRVKDVLLDSNRRMVLPNNYASLVLR